MNLKSYIGLRVKAARHEKGLTQEQFAAHLGKAVETISNIERGAAFTGLETLEKIASLTDKPMSFFFEGVEGARSASPRRLAIEEELRVQVSSLSDGDLSLVVALLKTWMRERS